MMEYLSSFRRQGFGVLLFLLMPAWVSTGYAQEVGSTFRDCDDCPEMVVLPAGPFMMGADKNFEDASDAETPRHKVTIGQPFAIGKYEVTQAEWVAVMGGNPSKFKGRSRPVEQVSWNDAQEFVKRLSAKTGQTYRLPTEAEWEYAVRAGTETTWSWGDDGGKAGQYAWYEGNARKETHPVGQRQPNGFGLFDMHGNVQEWVEDCWHDSYAGAPGDGRAWTSGTCESRMLRGGLLFYDSAGLRSAFRGVSSADSGYSTHGFRVARTVSP